MRFLIPFILPVTAALAVEPFDTLERQYAGEVLPVLNRLCHDCHNADKFKGDLDLARFATVADARRDAKVWQHSLEMLGTGEMPPEKKPQPTREERLLLEKWITAFLDAEARSRAGDPGRVVMRRLSNFEFTNTVRDLTGVALEPAKEFPVDGAAGEGFVNVGEALVMSPALLDKYLAAAKGIAAQAVLLPDGFRFSPSARRGDWVAEVQQEIRALYAKHTASDAGTAINLQGVKFATNAGGRLPMEKYIAATLGARPALAAGDFENVAKQRGLSPRYLAAVWSMLNGTKPSPVLDPIRASWRGADEKGAPAIAAEVARWQAALVKFQNVGHMKPWMVPVSPLAARQDVRVKLNGESLFLAARGSGGVRWENPRLVSPGQPDLALRDVRELARAALPKRDAVFAATAKSLAAAGENGTRAELARKHGVEEAVLAAWFDFLGIGTPSDMKRDYFTQRIAKSGAYDFVKGWGEAATPNVIANSSKQHVRVPGNMRGGAVAVHPSPTLDVVAAWRSPVATRVRVEAAITHAHPECGNGVSWALELRRGALRQRLAAGGSNGGNRVAAPPVEALAVQPGDFIALVIGARDGNHSCDLTDIELVVKGAEEWNLAREISPDILAGNPHADARGIAGVWHFHKEPAGTGGAVLPAGSLLARWQMVPAVEKPALAEELQRLLLGAVKPAKDSPDAALLARLSSLRSGPVAFFRGVSAPEKASDFGVEPSLFTGGNSLPMRAGTMLEVKLPAALAEGCEFVATAVMEGAEGHAQVLAQTTKPGDGPAAPPFLAADGSPERARLEAAFEEFRAVFPAAVCYPQIVPVDEVITLTVFHREDEALSRLVLDDAEHARLDRLWAELRFVGRDALTMVDAYEQLWQYATQDSNPKLFEPLKPLIDARAAAFRQELAAAEPRQLEHLVTFAERAWRRPLAAAEKEQLRALYAKVRSEDIPHDEALRLTLARVLVAPAFLYRTEQPAAAGGAVSGVELASRLSYFLWSSMPDSALLASASKLHDPPVLLAEAKRMLADSRARALAQEFACQWLHVRDVGTLDEKSERHFPEFKALRGAMEEEATRFFTDLFQRDGSVMEILTADHTFVNGVLAKHYGFPGVNGDEWRRVDGIRAQGRGGVLGMAAVLAKQSGASRTSPILRGNWVVETLLGEKLPRPPKNVPQLPESESDGELTMREITQRHTADPNCAGCHARIDPFGFALEKYDPIGRLREKDLAGRPVVATAKLRWRDTAEFDGLPGLRDYLATRRSDVFLRTFCRKLLGYALGRSVQLSDAPLVEEMQRALRENGFRFSVALNAVVASRQFREIRGLE